MTLYDIQDWVHLTLSFSWTLTLGTQKRYCKEAQGTWRGHV